MWTKDFREWFWGKNKNRVYSPIYNRIKKVISLKWRKPAKNQDIYEFTQKRRETALVHEGKVTRCNLKETCRWDSKSNTGKTYKPALNLPRKIVRWSATTSHFWVDRAKPWLCSYCAYLPCSARVSNSGVK